MSPHDSPLFHSVITRIDSLCVAGAVLGAACLAGLFLLIIAEVLARNLLGQSISFSWDIAAYCMGCCFFLSAGQTLAAGGHVRVTALKEVLPTRGAFAVECAACGAGFLVALVLLYAMGQMAWLSFVRGSTAASIVKTPLWIPQAVMAFGALVFALSLVARILRVIRGEEFACVPATEDSL